MLFRPCAVTRGPVIPLLHAEPKTRGGVVGPGTLRILYAVGIFGGTLCLPRVKSVSLPAWGNVHVRFSKPAPVPGFLPVDRGDLRLFLVGFPRGFPQAVPTCHSGELHPLQRNV